MPFSLRHGGQCVYCTLHTRRLALQSLRLPQSAPKRLFHGTRSSTQANIRRLPAGDSRQGYRPERAPSHTVEGSNGIVRRTSQGPKEGGQFSRHQGQSFEQQLEIRLEQVKEELRKAPLLEQVSKEKKQAGHKADSFDKIWQGFTGKLKQQPGASLPFLGVVSDTESELLMGSLRDAFNSRGVHGLDGRLKYAFYTHLISPRFTSSDITNQRTLADLRYPSEWFPNTRRQPRKVHLHVGPTNSGKTYHALQRLEEADSGIYAGPLRLLAHEVYTRLNAKGKRCSLITGEERRMADEENNDFGALSACTVEMMPLNRAVDVAVIDEIQMIGSSDRGWAWTQAFLGVRAVEIHLCGEERTVPLVTEICASLGEKLQIHRYQRLSPLEMEEGSMNGKLSDLRKGDCIVSFSVMSIHALRRQIERETGKKVATVYGSLPPETRAAQARLFNDPDNDYDFLVASDAVGMGLNLAIKRIIFEASNKFDGYTRRMLPVADIKQIAGRAGRYRVATHQAAEDEKQVQPGDLSKEDLAAAKGEGAPPAGTALTNPERPTEPPVAKTDAAEETRGLVTTLEKFDYPIVRAAMSAAPEPIHSAGLFPPASILERFASYFPPFTPFSYILTRLHELSQMHPRFHLCGLRDQVWIADHIESVQGLTVTDRNIICSCPAGASDRELWATLLPAYAKCIAEQTGGALFDIQELPLEILESEVSASRQYLRELEQLHKGLVTYLWLSYRFAGVFYTRSLAFHVKSMVEKKIEEVLSKFSFTEANRRRMAAAREKQLLEEMEATRATDEAEGQAQTNLTSVAAEHDSGSAEKGEAVGLRGHDLREQTSLTAGGDHFGGEAAMRFEEPIGDEDSELPSFDTRDALRTELDASNVKTPGPSETALNSDQTSLETHQAPSQPLEAHDPHDEPSQKPGGFKQFGAGVPPKHLAHLDVDAKQPEQDWATRP